MSDNVEYVESILFSKLSRIVVKYGVLKGSTLASSSMCPLVGFSMDCSVVFCTNRIYFIVYLKLN